MSDIDFGRLPQPILREHEHWVELYNVAWKLAATHIRTSRRRRHMDVAWWEHAAHHNYQWVWDACFMAMYCRYAADQFPGIQSLDNFYELQRDDGYISMTYDVDTGEEPWPDRINPPLFAWAEWEYYRATGDSSRLARAVGHIERLMAWIDANRRTAPHPRLSAQGKGEKELWDPANRYQLYWFEDCGSSGMDDSPRTPRDSQAGPFFDWIDLSSQMALSFGMLGNIHETLGNAAKAVDWRGHAQKVGELVNSELWCERTSFYHDRTLPANFIPSKTAASFWPMLAGICPPDRAAALVEHLRNPAEFNRPLPVPALSADDPNYSPQGVYWLGGVWAPTNYMIARGLVNVGRPQVAHEIACKYIEGMWQTYAQVEPHTIWECYCAEGPRPGIASYRLGQCRGDFVGWSGIGPIAMLIENVLGVELDAAGRRVGWTILLTEEHGIRQLPIGGGATVDLLCRKRASADSPAAVTVTAQADITLELSCQDRRVQRRILARRAVELTI